MNNLQNLSYAPVEFVICAGKTQTTETETEVIYHLKNFPHYIVDNSVNIESCMLPLHEDPIIFVLYTLVKFLSLSL